MFVDLRRGTRNYFFLLVILISILNVIFGYVLLKTLDKVEVVTFRQLWLSVYTVYTQFGPLLFSSIFIIQFYVDYKEKNIIFYKSLNKDALSYFVSKLTTLIIGTLIGTLVSSLLICLPYSEYKLLPVVFLQIQSVMIFYCVTISVLGFIFSNFLLAFFSNFFIWILGIIISNFGELFRYFAFYDASTYNYKLFVNFIDKKTTINLLLTNIGKNYMFNLVLCVFSLLIVKIFQKRWIKNGI